MHTGATIKTTGQQTSLEKWKVWDEHKYLVKEKKTKKKTEDACTSQWQKASSQGSTITKCFHRISTAPQAIAEKTPKKSNIRNFIKKEIISATGLKIHL